ncbi:ATP-dependent RNA helicase DBP3 [Kwoniella shandongensis]|uniref:RNA helicase n=1 Tax=Kwoniella shandongensis TaxID=1734106 RepID=A0A5M6BXH6_9TREE|nr:ATP-dependent RNA helicase DBP3 [Kwoniella shandongensis]KAA5526135.1 ATP-dependent RNA helicase DBP3 [Kwoniella shandongensis]
MSITENETTPSLTKEEKRLRKEEKRKAKAAAAGTTAEASAPADGEVKVKREKKDKKDKKRSKDVAEEEAAAPAAPVAAESDAEERPKKKSKKVKTEPETSASATPAESVTPAAPTAEGDAAAPALSKKQQKKLAKAQAAAAAPASTSAVPVISISQTFTPEHNAYLKEQGITLQPSLYPPLLSIPSLPINPAIQPYLSAYTKPTPIQSCSWPALLVKRDVVGIAETGSGKTLAFGVPGVNLLSHLPPPNGGKKSKGGQIQMLVLAPTRELAQQSHDTLVALGKTVGLNSVCIFGGVGKDGQISELRKKETRIVVGTPGRTLDLADSGDLDLSSVSYLVLDEADRMLDQGFENDIRRIIAHTPGHEAGRQTVMFSATWPESVRRLASTFLNDPVRITVGSDELSANKRIEQVVEVLDQSFQKDARLLHHLRTHLKEHPNTAASPTRILVFALYKKEAQRLEFTIRKAGHAVGALHGDMTQDARFKALDAFKTGKQNVLVATDVAARGLDIPDVGLVINVTFPLTTEDFVHRCGRTGRAGKSGKAVTFFTGENHEKSLAGELMRVLRDAGAEIPAEMDRFPTTIKKKEHGSYGAWYKDTTNAPAPTKITFD